MKPYKVVPLGNAEAGAKATLAKLTEIHGYYMECGSISEATSVDMTPPSFFRKHNLDETTVELAKHINELGDRLGELDNASAKWESPANKLANTTSLLADQAAYKEEITDIQSTLADVKSRADRYKAAFTQNTFLTLLKSRAGDT
ncbi:unnamed protein product [Penicillium palitans]